MLRRSLLALSFLAILCTSQSGEAQRLDPASAPSQALETDQAAPWLRWGLSIDGLAPIWNEYVVTGHAMPSRYAGFRLSGGYRRGENASFLLRGALDIRPMGHSFDGLLLSVGAGWEGGRRVVGIAEAGYSVSWRGLFVSLAAGIHIDRQNGDWRAEPRARLSVGWTF